MAAQLQGEWQRQFLGYVGPSKQGTGINPVHYYYGSPAARIDPVNLREGEIVAPWQGSPENLVPNEFWGYTVEDSLYTGMHYDERPNWGQTSDEFRMETEQHPSWSAPGPVIEAFRATFAGAFRTFRGHSQAYSDIQYQIPSETVSEGWQNKPKGQPADASPSDPSQYERQTSMQQRYKTRTNQQAVTRATDEPRSPIQSKVTGQRIKIYSGGERHYDMLPKAQDDIPRPFWYRIAGTGRTAEMIPNTMWSIYPIERQPPPQPSIGPQETQISPEFGYTEEDGQYYG
jgi:hypothetical protein